MALVRMSRVNITVDLEKLKEGIGNLDYILEEEEKEFNKKEGEINKHLSEMR